MREELQAPTIDTNGVRVREDLQTADQVGGTRARLVTCVPSLVGFLYGLSSWKRAGVISALSSGIGLAILLPVGGALLYLVAAFLIEKLSGDPRASERYRGSDPRYYASITAMSLVWALGQYTEEKKVNTIAECMTDLYTAAELDDLRNPAVAVRWCAESYDNNSDENMDAEWF